MATMYEKMMERLVDRIADQAVERAKMRDELHLALDHIRILEQTLRGHDLEKMSLLRDLDQLKQAQAAYGQEHVITHLENLGMAERSERYNAEVRLEAAISILERFLVTVVVVGMDGKVYYAGDSIDPIVEEARAFLHPDPPEVACDGPSEVNGVCQEPEPASAS